MRTFGFLPLLLLCAAMVFTPLEKSAAQEFSFCEKSAAECRRQTNERRIGLIAGSARGTYIEIADDIKNAVKSHQTSQGEAPLRVVPMVGVGSIKNIEDLLYLQQTDIGLVQADVLEVFRIANQVSGRFQEVLDKIKYLAKVYNEEIHVVCRRGACGRYLGEVKDNVVLNLGPEGSGTWLTAQAILKALGFPEKNFRYMTSKEALGYLRNPGSASAESRIDGMIFVAGKPVGLFKDVREEDGLELVELTDAPPGLDVYVSGSIEEHDNYTGLLGNNDSVQTLAVPAVLAVYGFDDTRGRRYRNLKAFCEALVAQADELRKGAAPDQRRYHEKWAKWDPSIEIKGWRRHPLMREALETVAP